MVAIHTCATLPAEQVKERTLARHRLEPAHNRRLLVTPSRCSGIVHVCVKTSVMGMDGKLHYLLMRISGDALSTARG